MISYFTYTVYIMSRYITILICFGWFCERNADVVRSGNEMGDLREDCVIFYWEVGLMEDFK